MESVNRTFTVEISCHEDACLRAESVTKRHCERFEKTRDTGGEVVKYGHRRHKMCYTIRWKPDLDFFRFDAQKREIGVKVRPKAIDERTNKTCGKECGEKFGLEAVLGPRNWWSAVDVWKSENNTQWALVPTPP